MSLQQHFRALVSSDWNECLAPCGPFDAISFHYPETAEAVSAVFREYTSNAISLGEAVRRIGEMVPAPVTVEQMDAYLDVHFQTYRGVPELVRWCGENRILFMINTTGMIGYFQRIFARGLFPPVSVLSAHPMVRFAPGPRDPEEIIALRETTDKGKNTAAVAQKHGIPTDRIVIMGDSGGDGPHFRWGAASGALVVGSMTKSSLTDYCRTHGVRIHHHLGIRYAPGSPVERRQEMDVDFMDLVPVIVDFLEKGR
jgi:2-hydroxy-3-keto-5-methylthiopentenyl-1-phosphate phosphatase